MRGVVCAGSIVVDVGKIIEAYPPLDHITTIEDVSLSTGGPGLNMAVDLRALGATFPLAVLGAVGDDQHGAFVLDECARLGIDTAGVARSSTTSGPTACSTAVRSRCPRRGSCTSGRRACTR